MVGHSAAHLPLTQTLISQSFSLETGKMKDYGILCLKAGNSDCDCFSARESLISICNVYDLNLKMKDKKKLKWSTSA